MISSLPANFHVVRLRQGAGKEHIQLEIFFAAEYSLGLSSLYIPFVITDLRTAPHFPSTHQLSIVTPKRWSSDVALLDRISSAQLALVFLLGDVVYPQFFGGGFWRFVKICFVHY